MKKYLFAAAALILALSCSKNQNTPVQPSTAPAFSWEANAGFELMEIEEDMSSVIAVSSESGIASFTVTFSTLPVELIGILNTMISVADNKATSSKAGVIDFVADGGATSKLSGVLTPIGAGLKGAKSASFDIGALITKLCYGQILENGSRFALDIAVKDAEGQLTQKSATFKWTSAPEIVLNPSASTISLESSELEYQYNVDAPGKIAHVIISFTGNGDSEPDPGIIALVKNYTKADASINLAEMPKVAKVFGLPSDNIVGQTALQIDLSTLLLQLSLSASQTGSETILNVEVKDQLGKVTRVEVGLAN